MTYSASVGSTKGLGYVLVIIIAGAMSTVFTKMQYAVPARGLELCADPKDPTRKTHVCPFGKPWFGVLLTRIGLTACLLYIRVAYRRASTRQKHSEQEPLLPLSENDDDNETRRLPLKTLAFVAGLAMLDVVQNLLCNVGLLWVSSSVAQMARGSFVPLSAVVSVRLLNARIALFQYLSIAIVCIALALVCWAGTPHDESTAIGRVPLANALLGLALIVLAQLVTAVQIIGEEYSMEVLRVGPILLAGVEGAFGLAYFVVLIPVLALTPNSTDSTIISKIWHEDFVDTAIKLSNSWIQVLLAVLFTVSYTLFGVAANYVTRYHSAVVCSIAQTLRILGVWVTGIFLYYGTGWRGDNSPGEPWTWYSCVQLVGFVLMMYGSLAYEKIVELPLRGLYKPKQVS